MAWRRIEHAVSARGRVPPASWPECVGRLRAVPAAPPDPFVEEVEVRAELVRAVPRVDLLGGELDPVQQERPRRELVERGGS